jgi:hypothetical protein
MIKVSNRFLESIRNNIPLGLILSIGLRVTHIPTKIDLKLWNIKRKGT